MIGTFKQQRSLRKGSLIWVYEDKELDEIYDSLSDLKIDIENKIDELAPEVNRLSEEADKKYEAMIKLEDEFDVIENKYREDEDNEELLKEYNKVSDLLDDATDEYDEVYKKYNALDDTLYNLKEFKDKIDLVI